MKVKSETSPTYGDPKLRAMPDDDQAIVDRAMAILARRCRRGAALAGPKEVGQYLMVRYAASPIEIFGAVLLDTRHRILGVRELAHGTISACTVHPRETVRAVLDAGAAAVLLWHNHPSGRPDPSDADRRLTRTLAEALALIDVRVLDHIVVGAEGYASFAERGLL